MDLSNYHRPAFGPSRLGLRFGLSPRGLNVALGTYIYIYIYIYMCVCVCVCVCVSIAAPFAVDKKSLNRLSAVFCMQL